MIGYSAASAKLESLLNKINYWMIRGGSLVVCQQKVMHWSVDAETKSNGKQKKKPGKWLTVETHIPNQTEKLFTLAKETMGKKFGPSRRWLFRFRMSVAGAFFFFRLAGGTRVAYHHPILRQLLPSIEKHSKNNSFSILLSKPKIEQQKTGTKKRCVFSPVVSLQIWSKCSKTGIIPTISGIVIMYVCT